MSGEKLRLGILAQYLHTRPDIIQLINSLSGCFSITVFAKAPDKIIAQNFATGVVIRELGRPSKKYNTFCKILFDVFGKIPRSRANYFITENFMKHQLPQNTSSRRLKNITLFLSRLFSGIISYDKYISMLKQETKIPLNDMDMFLCFTPVYDDVFFSELTRSKSKINVYVYSWDHACKMKCFSKKVNYLVWNNGIKDDVAQLQAINLHNIAVWGSSQLAFIDLYRSSAFKNKLPAYTFKYMYFACATGYDSLAKQEVMYIHIISEYLKNNFPHYKLVVRTYPFLKAKEIYQPLAQNENVVLENTANINSIQISVNSIFEKMHAIQNAVCFIHLGTTLGLEAAYFDTPVLKINYAHSQKRYGISGFIHQYQNDKYLNLAGYPNIVHSNEELKKAVKEIISGENDYMSYNIAVRKITEVFSFDELASTLQKKIN